MTMGAILLFGETEEGPLILRLMGRFHPGIVHFPIALLTLAAVMESWQLFRRKQGMSPVTPVCLVLGAFSAVIASILGWLLNEYEMNRVDNTLVLHMWLGFAAAGVGILAAAFVMKAPHSGSALFALRALLFTGAALVGATGYLGGDLVYGFNHLFHGLFDPPKIKSTESGPKPPVANGKVDFQRDIAPILTDYCLKCHGGTKKSGKLDLKTYVTAFKGGANGPCIVPNKPDESKLYTFLITKDEDEKMPPPKEKLQLSEDQIKLIRKWIEEGAEWPQDVILKPKE